MNSSAKKGEQIMKQIIESVTLKVLSAGSDETNLKILRMLPATANKVESIVKLKAPAVNRRIKELMLAKLVFRKKAGTPIILTELGTNFLKHLHQLEAEVLAETKTIYDEGEAHVQKS